MKNQLLQELSVLHEKVAAIKVYDRENASLLGKYTQEFEALLTRLLTFNTESFKSTVADYHKNITGEAYTSATDLHDDTDNSNGFYASVANLNNNINDSIEIVNGL